MVGLDGVSVSRRLVAEWLAGGALSGGSDVSRSVVREQFWRYELTRDDPEHLVRARGQNDETERVRHAVYVNAWYPLHSERGGEGDQIRREYCEDNLTCRISRPSRLTTVDRRREHGVDGRDGHNSDDESEPPIGLMARDSHDGPPSRGQNKPDR